MSGRTYITIVRWPKGFTAQDRLEALADAMGIDPYTAGLRAVQEPPLVAGMVDELVAPDIIARFKAHRTLAFALTQAHIARLPKPQLVKRLTPAIGADDPMYMVELWRAEPTGLKASDIFLLVRGTVDRSTTRTRISGSSATKQAGGLATLGGAALGAVVPGGVDISHTTEIHLTQLLDIYLNDHSLLRLNSDRVSFDVLGKQRGFTAAENMDKIATLLGTQAPGSQLDTGFTRFKPPADCASEMTSSAAVNVTKTQRDESSAFDFYSGWIYTITRALTPR
jgi:hypothetical protein